MKYYKATGAALEYLQPMFRDKPLTIVISKHGCGSVLQWAYIYYKNTRIFDCNTIFASKWFKEIESESTNT